ncbi:zinc finger protein interacting with ribonucleoprotein K [Drosophila nasuta]|uniref:zinc finger protein interacting with ribonucleoprotein K n=1 Tax=Drosophila nasuta TaxID=42062 RepID=UPI00295EB93C|nr:zinc finger protein interacting with ribonucleoprotein K [Drosophila nasuta]
MIKLERPTDITSSSNFNFRCGDVLCVGPKHYDVCCALCAQRVPYDVFPEHFRQQHLPQTEVDDCKLDEDHLDVEPVEVEVEVLTLKSEDDPIASNAGQLQVDLAQIALLDQQHTAVECDTIATRRQLRRRATTLKSTTELEPWTIIDEDDGPQLQYNNEEEESELKEQHEEDKNEEVEQQQEDKEPELDDTRDMLFQCDLCERAYNTKRSLQSHKRSKHNERRPRNKHIMTLEAATPEPTADPVACISSSNNSASSRTKSRKGPAKVYKCAESGCNQTFRTERDLRGHRWKHTGIFCDICGKPFTQSGNMMRHRQRHSGIKPYKCQEPKCEATFYTQKELTSHNICHTGRMPCICEICGRPCRDRGVLTAHMRRHTGERPAKCEVCDKSFYSYHDLNVHAVSHTNLRPFVCDVCGSTFQRKKALRVHKLLHSEQRKYSCKLCNKSFAQSGGLNAHMRTHETAKARVKGKSAALLTPIEVVEELVEEEDDIVEEVLQQEEEEGENDEEVLQEAVTIELIQQEHVEVVTVSAAGSWHVA